MIAYFVKELREGDLGAAIYYVEPPATHDGHTSNYLICSSANILGHYQECYAFLCDKDGEWLSNSEMDGSEKGTISHERVLNNMGYRLVPRLDCLDFFEAL